jgi:hypothetical protein
MCPLSPPPAAVFLAWPWQAPWSWLDVGLIVALLVWLVIRDHRRAVNRASAAAARQLRGNRLWVLWERLSVLIPSSSLVLLLLVAIPSIEANDAWYQQQFARFEHLDCSLRPLFAIVAAHQRSILVTVVIWVGLILLPVPMTLLAYLVANMTARRDG